MPVAALTADQSIAILTGLTGLIGAMIAVFRLIKPAAVEAKPEDPPDDRDEHIADLRMALSNCQGTVKVLRHRLHEDVWETSDPRPAPQNIQRGAAGTQGTDWLSGSR